MNGTKKKQRIAAIVLAVVLAVTLFPVHAWAGTWLPIGPYVQDTEYDVPKDYMVKKAGVDYGQVQDIEYASTATNSVRKAKVILPAGYSAEERYPVLYLLHGIFGNETTLYNDGVQTVIGNAIASGSSEKMIVVLPNACANETGAPPDVGFSLEHYAAYDNFINDFKDCLMPYINEHFATATGRENTAISGFSMGGRVSLHIGFTLQDTVRYIGAFNPAFGIFEYENYGVHEDGLFTEETFDLQPQYRDDMLVLIAAGTNDGIVRDEPERYHNALAKNEAPHIYYATDGVNANGQPSNGGHDGDVYKHGLYNFMRRIFHQSADPEPAPSNQPLMHLSFEDGIEGLKSDGVKVTAHGTPDFSQNGVKGKAISMAGGDYLEITKSDGTSLLTGYDAITISYWSKTQSKTNWATYLSPDDKAQSFGKENYLGIIDNNASVTVERYKNSGSRPASASGNGKADAWKHVAVVVTREETRLYLDGKRVKAVESSHKLTDILGGNSIFYIGKACWGAGEYYDGQMDEYSLYGFDMSDSQVNNLYHGRDLDDDSYIATEQMQRHFDRLSLGKAIPDGAIMEEGKITLPTQLDGATVTWTSDKKDVVEDDGTVHLPGSATDVALTARISADGETARKKFVVPVLPLSEQKAYFESSFVIPCVVAEGMALPAAFGQGKVAWSGSAVSSDGKIRASAQEQDVTLTAVWQKGSMQASKSFQVKVLASDAMAFEAYTRVPLTKDVYGGKLAYSLHLAHKNTDGSYEALYANNGILYAKAEITAQSRLLPKNMKNPYVFAMPDGKYGIVAVRTDSSNEDMVNAEDDDSKGKALLFTTEDFIHYEEIGLIDLNINAYVLDITCEYDSSTNQYVIRWCDTVGNYYRSVCKEIRSLSAETERGGIFGYEQYGTNIQGACERNQFYVKSAVGERMIQKFSTIYNTSVHVPQSVSAQEPEEVMQVKAELHYSDGSKAEKQVEWDLGGVDFKTPGTYTVSGSVQRAPSMKSSNHTSLGVNRADPCVYYNQEDGYYYFIATNDANNNNTFSIKKSKTLEGLKDAQETEILNLDMYPEINGMLWAPEIHKVGGELYIFFSANPGEAWNVQSHVMRFKGGELDRKENWERPVLFQNKDGGPLSEALGEFGGITLDMTTFQVNGVQYVSWAQRDFGRQSGSVLCIGTVDPSTPWKLTSNPTVICRPDYGWDNNDNTPVDEGPYAILRDGQVFLTFSGSLVGATYCVGLLRADMDGNLLDAKNWSKSNFPILYARAVEGEAGPGHNSYTTDAAGNLVFVYHARPVDANGNIGSRNAGLRTVHFGADGEPVLYMSDELELAKENEHVTMQVVVKDTQTPDPGPDDPTPGPDDPKPEPKPDDPAPTPQKPKKGEIFTGKDGLQFKVTAYDGKKKSVAAIGSAKSSYTAIVIPDTVTYRNVAFQVTSVEKKAFANQKKLSSVTLGKHIASIGAQAFYNDKNLKKVSFRGTAVKTVGKQAFGKIHKKAVFSMKKTFTVKNLTYKITKCTVSAKQVSVTGGTKKLASMKIPSTVTYNGMSFRVTAVAKKAFQKQEKLKSVTIGKYVNSIGEKAFYNCKRLKKVTFDGTAVKSIQKQAFGNVKKNVVFHAKKAKKAQYNRLLKKAGTKHYKMK